jgi:magnesium-transporting ATPase (P-type)
MENQEELSHKESLALIEEMIYKAKNSYHESGTSALLWGSIVMLCSAVSFANTWWSINGLYAIWWLTLVAIIPQVVISIRESKTQKFKSHTDDAMSGIWISFGIGIFILTFYTNVVKPEGSACLFLLLYGMPTFATGYTHRFKPMIVGGIVCWIGAIISVYTSVRTDFALFFVAAFFAWFLPGLILRRDYLKEKEKHV